MFSTQAFSAGVSQATGSLSGLDVPAKNKRQEDKQTCLPVTIRAIEQAVERRADTGGELLFHGSEPGMLLLVGLVESLSRQTASIELSLNDATGRIRVRHYVNDRQAGDLASLEAGRYVSLFGMVRTAPEVHFAATGMSLVQSADEVSYHMIESAYAAVRLQQQKGGPADAVTPMLKKHTAAEAGLSPPKTDKPAALPDAGVSSVSMVSNQPLSGSALRKAVLQFIQKDGDGKPEGVSFPSVCKHVDSTPADEVSSALEKLVDAGEIFTTIDDGHFQCL